MKPVDAVGLALVAAVAWAPGMASAVCGADVTPLNFGSYDVFAPMALRSTATITLTCDEAPPPNVTVGLGPSSNSSVVIPRLLRNNGGLGDLQYNVFTDPALGQVWGNGIAGGATVTVRVFRNRPAVLTVYGAIPAGQDVGAGAYRDDLPVSLLW
ncbi:MAG TPA: spore coat U domain-containing protein [Burkholderiales bacterium]